MMMNRTGRYVRDRLYFFVILGITALAIGGCGYKSLPVPPQDVVPKPITDLRYELSEKGVTLYWSFPTETVVGRDIYDISSFDLYRAVVPVDSYCETCPIPFRSPINIAGGANDPEQSRVVNYKATLLRPGHLYFFKIRSRVGWWAESADSNVISFVWYTPPRAPLGLTATSGDGEITLNWQAVTTNLDSTPVQQEVSYQVYRSDGGEAFVALGEPVNELSLVDADVVNGKKYFYKVQAFGIHEQGSVGGGLTDDVAAVPVDLTAPAAPTGVRAIGTALNVKVFWDASPEKDVTEYVIYRRVAGEKQATSLDRVHIPYTLYNDANPPTGAKCWYYSVSAVDDVSPPNEGERSVEVEVCD